MTNEELLEAIKILIESDVTKKIDLLVEGQKIIREKLIPEERISDIENRLDIAEIAITSIRKEVRELKKAN